MFYLHTSNRTENLLRHLAEVIRADTRRDLFAPELFLVQSQGMERIISQRMAEVFGVWCNFEYLLPLAFFETAGQASWRVDTPRWFCPGKAALAP